MLSNPITFSVHHRSRGVSRFHAAQFLPQALDFCDNTERFLVPSLPLGCLAQGTQLVDPSFFEVAFEFPQAGACLFERLSFVHILIGCHDLVQ